MEFLKQEIQATLQLNHTHIVKYHEFRENRTYVKKIGTRSFWIHFLSKNKFKTAIFEIWKFSDYVWKSWKWP